MFLYTQIDMPPEDTLLITSIMSGFCACWSQVRHSGKASWACAQLPLKTSGTCFNSMKFARCLAWPRRTLRQTPLKLNVSDIPKSWFSTVVDSKRARFLSKRKCSWKFQWTSKGPGREMAKHKFGTSLHSYSSKWAPNEPEILCPCESFDALLTVVERFLYSLCDWGQPCLWKKAVQGWMCWRHMAGGQRNLKAPSNSSLPKPNANSNPTLWCEGVPPDQPSFVARFNSECLWRTVAHTDLMPRTLKLLWFCCRKLPMPSTSSITAKGVVAQSLICRLTQWNTHKFKKKARGYTQTIQLIHHQRRRPVQLRVP